MNRLLSILLGLNATLAHAQSVTLAWDASPSAGVVDYRIHFGTNAGNYAFVTNAGLTLTQTVVLPHPGRWFFAATAVAANGLESEFSNVVEWEAKPAPPLMTGGAWVRLLPVIERSTNGVGWLSITGAPTFVAATNAAVGFLTRRLVIERVERVMKP